MKKGWFIFFMLFLTPALFASQQKETDRGVLAGIAHIEGRGLSNIFLFPVEWPIIAKKEYRDHGWASTVTFIPQVATHICGRVFSGISDIVFLPFYYPFSRYDDSVPVGMGWGEYPWQTGIER